jgi:hypothetical protein
VPRFRIAIIVIGALLLAAGCDKPPDLQPPPGVPLPSVTASPEPTRLALPSTTVTALPSPKPSFPELYYVPCLGAPSGEQVVATVRAKTKLLPQTGAIAVTTGPLCSGTWQYTILQAPNRDPLLVVTKGEPAALSIVTAGSDVCSIKVRTQAPAGLLAAASC